MHALVSTHFFRGLTQDHVCGGACMYVARAWLMGAVFIVLLKNSISLAPLRGYRNVKRPWLQPYGNGGPEMFDLMPPQRGR